MNKISGIIIALLVILIALVAYGIFKPKGMDPVYSQLNQTDSVPLVTLTNNSTTVTPRSNVASNPPSAQIANPIVPPTSKNLITKNTWGVSLMKSSDWNITTNTESALVLSTADDIITVTHVTGSSITDSDAKFGPITYSYSNANNAWMVEMPDEQASGMHTKPSTVATVVAYTQGGLPIFNGTGRWKTYIVPTSHTTFLKFTITGSGNTQPLTTLLQTLQSL